MLVVTQKTMSMLMVGAYIPLTSAVPMVVQVSGRLHVTSTTSLLAGLLALLTCIHAYTILPPQVHILILSKQIKLDI